MLLALAQQAAYMRERGMLRVKRVPLGTEVRWKRRLQCSFPSFAQVLVCALHFQARPLQFTRAESHWKPGIAA